MKTIKDLRKKLTQKKGGSYYIYKIAEYTFRINEFNNNRGWCLNTYKNQNLIDSYGHNGLTLKECKQMILTAWNTEILK